MRKIMTLVVLAGISMVALVGCKAEGEVGDAATSIASPR